MQLTLYTDYSLRVLIYLALEPDRLVTIHEIAEAYGISRHHLVKVVQHLRALGYIHSVRGKKGGLRLARPPEEIVVGEVVRKTEPHLNLMECLDEKTSTCVITPHCALKGVLRQALNGFIAVLDRYTVADVVKNRHVIAAVLVHS